MHDGRGRATAPVIIQDVQQHQGIHTTHPVPGARQYPQAYALCQLKVRIIYDAQGQQQSQFRHARRKYHLKDPACKLRGAAFLHPRGCSVQAHQTGMVVIPKAGRTDQFKAYCNLRVLIAGVHLQACSTRDSTCQYQLYRNFLGKTFIGSQTTGGQAHLHLTDGWYGTLHLEGALLVLPAYLFKATEGGAMGANPTEAQLLTQRHTKTIFQPGLNAPVRTAILRTVVQRLHG